jgi:hypothetical protein
MYSMVSHLKSSQAGYGVVVVACSTEAASGPVEYLLIVMFLEVPDSASARAVWQSCEWNFD